MNVTKRNPVKIVIGLLLVLVFAANIPRYMNGSSQANMALVFTAIFILGGFYLLYKGLYPSK